MPGAPSARVLSRARFQVERLLGEVVVKPVEDLAAAAKRLREADGDPWSARVRFGHLTLCTLTCTVAYQLRMGRGKEAAKSRRARCRFSGRRPDLREPSRRSRGQAQ